MSADPGSAAPPGQASASTQDALQVLGDEHRRIEALLADCERLAADGQASSADRSGVVSHLGALLIAHAQMEQQLFYPAIGAPASEADAAIREHEAVEQQLERLSVADAPASAFASGVAALAQAVRAHLRHEEDRLFARARASGIDLQALGTQLALRRGELLGDQGVD